MKKNKIIIFISFILIISIGFGFFVYNISKNEVKNFKIGNNSSSQEIANYILNISSYEIEAEVEVNSNKTTNKYVVKQKYISPDTSTIEVIEPENLQGMKIIKQDNKLKIENTQINASKLFEDYKGMTDNIIDLSNFIENYKNNNGEIKEENNNVIMTAKNLYNNKYIQTQKLYIDRTNGNISKMEITDVNQKTTIFIIYKEVKINEIKKEDVTAFRMNNLISQI